MLEVRDQLAQPFDALTDVFLIALVMFEGLLEVLSASWTSTAVATVKALEHYRDADRRFGGSWLIEEHMAEILAATGKHQEARDLYVPLVERTNSPELMGALAGVLVELGDKDAAKKYVDRAEAIYLAQLKSHPEAAIGHALDHFIDQENVDVALKLAQQNHELRAGGPAKVSLISAYLLKGDVDAARAVADQLAKSEYVSADGYMARAEVAKRVGDKKAGAALAEKARAINPKI